MDEDMIYQMTGKTLEEADEIIEKFRQRSIRAKEHQRLTREIFDMYWPSSVNSRSKEDWGYVCEEVDRVINYLNINANFFPNYERHIEQWNTLKKVAGCVCCGYTKPCDNACLSEHVKRQISKVA